MIFLQNKNGFDYDPAAKIDIKDNAAGINAIACEAIKIKAPKVGKLWGFQHYLSYLTMF